MKLRGVYVVTDAELRPDRSHIDIAAAACLGGACAVQLRDKRSSGRMLLRMANTIREMTRQAGVLFIVNDRLDIALASRADGVHLGPDDISPADARQIVGPTMLIGVSIGTVEEALAAAPYADYLGVGAIYGSATKSDAGPAVGSERIMAIRKGVPNLPVVAIGGIHTGNIRSVIQAGADAAAVVSAVVCADDMVGAVRELRLTVLHA